MATAKTTTGLKLGANNGGGSLSNCICQDAVAVHFRRLLHSALAMVTSFLATAVMMTLWG